MVLSTVRNHKITITFTEDNDIYEDLGEYETGYGYVPYDGHECYDNDDIRYICYMARYIVNDNYGESQVFLRTRMPNGDFEERDVYQVIRDGKIVYNA